MKLAKIAFAPLLAVAAATAPSPSAAYPIDCAILLCMAGGFPPSAECTAAKAEVIRRITPIPVEPPLQLWNCPMRMDPDLARQIGLSLANVGADGLTPDVRKYRDAIEIYDVRSFSKKSGSEASGEYIDHTARGIYASDGTFSWVAASYRNGPAWLSDVPGGTKVAITRCVRYSRDGDCTAKETIGSLNGYNGPLRAILMRFRDHEGKYHTDFVKY